MPNPDERKKTVQDVLTQFHEAPHLWSDLHDRVRQYWQKGQLEEGLKLCADSYQLGLESGNSYVRAASRLYSGLLLFQDRESPYWERAAAYCEESAALFHGLGDRDAEGVAWLAVGRIADAQQEAGYDVTPRAIGAYLKVLAPDAETSDDLVQVARDLYLAAIGRSNSSSRGAKAFSAATGQNAAAGAAASGAGATAVAGATAAGTGAAAAVAGTSPGAGPAAAAGTKPPTTPGTSPTPVTGETQAAKYPNVAVSATSSTSPAGASAAASVSIGGTAVASVATNTGGEPGKVEAPKPEPPPELPPQTPAPTPTPAPTTPKNVPTPWWPQPITWRTASKPQPSRALLWIGRLLVILLGLDFISLAALSIFFFVGIPAIRDTTSWVDILVIVAGIAIGATVIVIALLFAARQATFRTTDKLAAILECSGQVEIIQDQKRWPVALGKEHVLGFVSTEPKIVNSRVDCGPLPDTSFPRADLFASFSVSNPELTWGRISESLPHRSIVWIPVPASARETSLALDAEVSNLLRYAIVALVAHGPQNTPFHSRKTFDTEVIQVLGPQMATLGLSINSVHVKRD